MQKRYHRVILMSIVLGIALGAAASGAWRRADYYEPARIVLENDSVEGTPDNPGSHLPVPQRRFFLFTSSPWETVTKHLGIAKLGSDNSDSIQELLKKFSGKDLTYEEKYALVKILLTRLNSSDREMLFKMEQGDVSLDEAFDTYSMLREKLTEDELTLVLDLMKRHRDELEEMIRK